MDFRAKWNRSKQCHPRMAGHSEPKTSMDGKEGSADEIPAAQTQPKTPLSQQASQQQQSSQDAPVEPDQDFNFAFKNARDTRKSMGRDPTEESVKAIVEAKDEQQLKKAIWDTGMFRDCSQERELVSFVKQNLTRFHNCKKTHREIAEENAEMSLLAPTPVIQAVRSICLKDGLHEESFLAFIESNINWLEHHKSRLGAEIPPEEMRIQNILNLQESSSDGEEAKAQMNKRSRWFQHKLYPILHFKSYKKRMKNKLLS